MQSRDVEPITGEAGLGEAQAAALGHSHIRPLPEHLHIFLNSIEVVVRAIRVRFTKEAVKSQEVTVQPRQDKFFPEYRGLLDQILSAGETGNEMGLVPGKAGRLRKFSIEDRQLLNIIIGRHLAEQVS